MRNRVMAIILAAGKGTRMKSKYPKVVHKLCGYPMVSYVIDAVLEAGVSCLYLVVGHRASMVREKIGALYSHKIGWVAQEEQRGTGHAVRTALSLIEEKKETTLMVCGDTPLLRPESLRKFLETHLGAHCVGDASPPDCSDRFSLSGESDSSEKPSDLTIMTAVLDDPFGYGRIVRDENGDVLGIVEERDAISEERKIKEINAGIYCVETGILENVVVDLRNDNVQGEFYLTDIAGLIRRRGGRVEAFRIDDPDEIKGINDRVELARAQQILETRYITELMKSGVTIHHPESVYLEKGVEVGRDTVMFPNCFLMGAVRVGKGCIIGGNCCLKDTTVGNEVQIGFGSFLDTVVIPSGTFIPPCSILKG